MDSQYGVPVRLDSGTVGTYTVRNSAQTTVSSGSVTVSVANDSPSGTLTLNATNVKLAKYNVTSNGEAAKFSQLSFIVANPSGVAWTDMRNLRVLFNGSEVGTLQTTAVNGTTYNVTANFTVAAGTTGVIEINGDVAASTSTVVVLASGHTVRATLAAGSSNVQFASSLSTPTTPYGATAGNALTVSTSAINASRNSSLGNQTVVASTNGVKIASVLINSSASESVDLSSLVFGSCTSTCVAAGAAVAAANSLGAAFTNLKLMRNGAQVAQTVTTSTADVAATTYTFNLSPAVLLAPTQSAQFDLYADVISGATWTALQRSYLASASGTGQVTSATVSASSTLGSGNIMQALTVSAQEFDSRA